MIETDCLVIGAGPVGLFQVFQLGLLGLTAEVVDALPEPGGQCVALYPDKPIYDVPGIPACTGLELTERLLEQASPFLTRRPDDPRPRSSPQLHLGQRVDTLAVLPEGGFEARTDQGVVLRAKAVFVAAGAGAFVPRTLSLPGLTQAANVHHHLPTAESPAPWAGQHLAVSGGGEEAVLAILGMLSAPADRRPARITLLHRRDVFQAEPEHEAALREHLAQGRVQLALGVPDDCVLSADARQVQALRVLGPDGQHQILTLDHLLIRQGLSPKLGPLVNWGLTLERKQVAVSPSTFESSVPGVYAVGDINTYPGKKRLLLCGFHEATLAAHTAHAALHPEAPQHLLYTTTSPLLKARLGRS